MPETQMCLREVNVLMLVFRDSEQLLEVLVLENPNISVFFV